MSSLNVMANISHVQIGMHLIDATISKERVCVFSVSWVGDLCPLTGGWVGTAGCGGQGPFGE